MGVSAPRNVIDDMFNQLDPDGDGVVDYQAFLKSICGAQARDFMHIMQRLVTSDSQRETQLRKVARRQRLAQEAAMEITDPFEILRHKLASGDGDGSFRKAFRKFKCRSAQRLGEETIDYRGFKSALLSMGVEMSEAKMRRVFNTIDKDGGRTIDYKEFASALSNDSVTKSGVKDWAKEVQALRLKQKEAYEAAAALIRNPSGLYVTLRNMFVGHTNAHKAFRSFLRLSGSTDSFLDMQEIKKSLKIKRINCAPGVVEGLFRHLDPDNDGQITFGEFTKAFIDMDLSKLIDLDLPPAESKFKIKKRKPRPASVAPGQALDILRDAIRERGSMRGLQLAFHRHRCQWKSVSGAGGVDIRGFQEALKSKGVDLPGTVVKGVFVMLDPANVGVLTYVQFRDAVQDVIPSSQTASQNTGSVVATNSWTRDAPARPLRTSAGKKAKTRKLRTARLPGALTSSGKLRLARATSDPSAGTRRPSRAGSNRLPKFRDVSKETAGNSYAKRDPNVALAATSLLRARLFRQQRANQKASIYRDPHTTIR
eukprot:INCI12204.1.p1 GENE.INCI12204.1~~INCI12204.1.p1  ORF type:complete len:578 (-),score=121.10 INCI12204.1:170-1786(-)